MVANLDTGFFAEPAWHGMGVVSEDGKPLPLEEAFRVGGLDWTVSKRPCCHTDGTPSKLKKFFITRDDTGCDLGVVNSTYEIMQNSALRDMLLEIGHNSPGVECHTLGALGSGERVWMLVKLPGDMVIRASRDDVVNQYLVMASSHDGTLAINVFWTPIRVVCQNTLTAALAGFKAKKTANATTDDLTVNPYGLTLKHTRNVSAKIAQARQALAISQVYFEAIGEIYRALDKVQVDETQVINFLDFVLPVPEKRPQIAEGARSEVIRLFETGKGNEGETAWDLWNGFTEYLDYDGGNFRNTAGKDASEEDAATSIATNRFESVLLNGIVAAKKRVAFDYLANEIAGIDTRKQLVLA